METDEIYCTKYALLAAKAGKHIHMEKPGGLELADFEELIATVKDNEFTPDYELALYKLLLQCCGV